MRSRRLRLALACLVPLAAGALVHHRIYTIPFFYSEVRGIAENGVIASLHAYATHMLTPRGLLAHPLSVLSFALDHAVHGGTVAGYHATNLAIHLLNAVLVVQLAERIGRLPALAGLVFVLHPLATACVAQLFGRNYSLATVFMLLAILLWTGRGERVTPTRGAAVALAIGLAVLAKQSFVIVPLVLVWYEVGAGGRVGRALGLGLAAAALAAPLVLLYAVPLSRTAAIPPGVYVLSQLGHVTTLLRFWLLPYQTALIHDLPLDGTAWRTDVWIGAALVAVAVGTAWRWRRTPAGFCLGAILLCLIPTNTVLPKNEIIREWRLYPTLPFLAILVACGVAALGERAAGPLARGALAAAVAVYLVLLADADRRQDDVYQSGVGAWRQVLARYPQSTDAMNNLALQLWRQGDPSAAHELLSRATTLDPTVFVYRENLAAVCRALGREDEAAAHAQGAADVLHRYGARSIGLHWR